MSSSDKFREVTFVTHAGKPHVDDSLAACMLGMLGAHVIRINRAQYPLYQNRADIKFFDIGGGKYDSRAKARHRDVGTVPYSSFGLLFMDYGKAFIGLFVDSWDENFLAIHDIFEREFVRAIDAYIGGFPSQGTLYRWVPYAITTFQNSSGSFDFMKTLFEACIDEIRVGVEAEARVKKALLKMESGLLMLDPGCSFIKEARMHNISADPHKVEFIVHPNGENWTLRAMPLPLSDNKFVKLLPAEWLDAPPKGCANNSTTFVHKRLTMATFETREDALAAHRSIG